MLKGEVSCLAPDAASLISKGDGLVMTVHTIDPIRADKIKNEYQDKLRSKWHQVMSEVDGRRVQAQKAEQLFKQYNQLISDLEIWFKDVPAKLEQVNNYEGQLESFTEEFMIKQSEIEKLNNLCNELKKLNVGYPETIQYSINTRWQEISSQFKRYSGGKNKNKFVTDKKMELEDVEGFSALEFRTRSNKLREAISTISRSLNATPLNGKDYELFQSQEECLKKIRNALNILKPSIEEINYLCETGSLHMNKEQADQVRRLSEKLREEWFSVNRDYTERFNRWTKCSDKWTEFHNACWSFTEYLDELFEALKKSPQLLEEIQSKFTDSDEEIAKIQKMLKNIELLYMEIVAHSSAGDIPDIKTNMERVKDRWEQLIAEFQSRRER